MSMTYTDKKVQKTTKVEVEAKGDEGLLNLLTNDTVFYVGGYPDTFKVSRRELFFSFWFVFFCLDRFT